MCIWKDSACNMYNHILQIYKCSLLLNLSNAYNSTLILYSSVTNCYLPVYNSIYQSVYMPMICHILGWSVIVKFLTLFIVNVCTLLTQHCMHYHFQSALIIMLSLISSTFPSTYLKIYNTILLYIMSKYI